MLLVKTERKFGKFVAYSKVDNTPMRLMTLDKIKKMKSWEYSIIEPFEGEQEIKEYQEAIMELAKDMFSSKNVAEEWRKEIDRKYEKNKKI